VVKNVLKVFCVKLGVREVCSFQQIL